MPEIQVAENLEELAAQAASMVCKQLAHAISKNGQARWVLAGGSTPVKAYGYILENHINDLDWSKVYFAIGDERCVSFDNPDSNWGQIKKDFLSKLPISGDNLLEPIYNESNILMAKDYAAKLSSWQHSSEYPDIDVLWLGMGEDGHTLSLFPGQEVIDNKRFVANVDNSPKPPDERISFTLEALGSVSCCLILAAGKQKADALEKVIDARELLPLGLVVDYLSEHQTHVEWLVDEDAYSNL